MLLDIRFLMLDIGGLLPILELRPLLNDQLDERGIVGREGQVGANGLGDLIERICDGNHGLLGRLQKLMHEPIASPEEQVSLRGEITVDRPLAHAKRFGEHLGSRRGVAVPCEQPSGRLKNLVVTTVA